MGRRRRTALRSITITLGAVALFGLVAGAKPVYAYHQMRCDPGYTAQPVSIAPVFACRAANTDPTAIQWPQAVATQHEIALYLAKLRVRVFHIDFVWGTSGRLAFDVAPPPLRGQRRRDRMMPDVTVSPRMRDVLNRAAEIGRTHTGERVVGTENALRALVEDRDSIAAQVLRELGVTERVAQRLDEIMSSESYRTPSRRRYFTPPNE